MATRMTIDRTKCVAPIEGYEGPYGYWPTLGAGIAFCVLFGLSLGGHIFTSIKTRTWWQLVFAVGALTEVVGWAGRTWSSKCPYETTPFLMETVTLILAPAFFTAGIYIILGRLIRSFGGKLSPIGPNTYLYIFCTADLVSLIIQAVGGAAAAAAYAKNPPADTTGGTRIMLAGIVFQLASVLIFALLFVWFVARALTSHGAVLRERRIQSLLAATVLSVACILIRSIYRTIELSQGWTGYLITHERYFIALDGTLMVLAVGVFNFVAPGWSERGLKGKGPVGEQDRELDGVRHEPEMEQSKDSDQDQERLST